MTCDECAERSSLSDADLICPGPTKNGYLQLCIEGLLRAQMADDKFIFPRSHEDALNNRFAPNYS